MTWAYVLAYSTLAVIALGTAITPLIYKWLHKHRWVVGPWE